MTRELSAGGVLVRRFHDRPFVAIVLIRKQGVWALPKGHPDDGESTAEAATREVREETGLDGRLVEKLGDIRYWYVRKGKRVRKTVSFFLFAYRSGRLADHDDEVLEASWVPLDEAPALLVYEGERQMARLALERVSSGALNGR